MKTVSHITFSHMMQRSGLGSGGCEMSIVVLEYKHVKHVNRGSTHLHLGTRPAAAKLRNRISGSIEMSTGAHR